MRAGARGRAGLVPLAAALAILAGAGTAVPASAQDLDDLLGTVGEDYARGYVAPLASALGTAALAGLSTTAAIPDGRLVATLGVRYAAVNIGREDQRFRTERRVVLDERFGLDPGDDLYGREGMLVAQGPSVFGDEAETGIVTAFLDGAPVYATEGIEGLWETRWPFLVVPEISLAGLAHLRATVRWLPEIELGDVGVSLFGVGAAWALSDLLPRSPVDVALGFFWQRVEAEDAVEARATSFFATASRSFGPLTGYVLAALEDSDLEADYTWDSPIGPRRVAFELDGRQDARLTLGATLRPPGIGPQLNAEIGLGELTTLSAGVLLGF